MPAIELLYSSALASGPDGQSIALYNAQPHPLLSELNGKARLSAQQHFRPQANALTALGVKPTTRMPEASFDAALLFPSKNKLQTLGWMAEAMQHLKEGGRLTVCCENKFGAKSYDQALKRLAGNCASSSKSKCRIFSARKGEGLDRALLEQWLYDAEPKRVETHDLISQPGLFSWDRPDIGSKLLLDHVPVALRGRGMDLCCGWGFLASHVVKNNSNIETLQMVDADANALACAEQNLADRDISIEYHWLDAASEVLPGKMEWIVCNPPFHSGQHSDIELGIQIIKNGCGALRRGGKLYLVANRKLPYEETLEKSLASFSILAQEEGFKIIEGIK